jgi:hypothetical protein
MMETAKDAGLLLPCLICGGLLFILAILSACAPVRSAQITHEEEADGRLEE